MNLLHISDIHFGPRHWEGNNERLLEKINSYAADIVINTGDNTTDGLESEYDEAGRFLKNIKCKNVISLIGNHDKRNMRSQELFKKHIYDALRSFLKFLSINGYVEKEIIGFLDIVEYENQSLPLSSLKVQDSKKVLNI